MKNFILSNLETIINSIDDQIYCFVCIETLLPYIKIFYCQPKVNMTTDKSIESCPPLLAILHPRLYEAFSIYEKASISGSKSESKESDHLTLFRKIKFITTSKMSIGDLILMPIDNFKIIERGLNRLVSHNPRPNFMFSEMFPENDCKPFRRVIKKHTSLSFGAEIELDDA